MDSKRRDFFYDTKFRQLYSVNARDAFQKRLLRRLEQSHIPSAAIDSRHLHLAHGIAAHKHQMLSFIASKVNKDKDSHSDDGDDELKRM